MSYQINYLATAVKNLQVNKIPALESAINRISKKINVTGVDDLIQNINQLREEYGILSKDDNLSSFKEIYENLLKDFKLINGDVQVLDATLSGVLSDVAAMKRAYKAITVMKDFTEIESTINSFKENYDNIFMLNENFERLDGMEKTFKELNYNELVENRKYKETNDYELIQQNLKQIVDEVYKFTKTSGDVITDKEYEFYSFTDDSTLKSTPMNYFKNIRDTVVSKVDQTEYNNKISTIETNISNKVDQTEYNGKISNIESTIASKVDQTEYNEKIASLESVIGDKIDQTEYNNQISTLESNINSKVDQTEYNEKIASLESDISDKVDQTEYNGKISSIESDISDKVDQTEYNNQISTLESNINSKVDQTEYNEKISTIESDIASKVDQTEYNGKISSIESDISDKVDQTEYNGKITDIESNIASKVDQTEYNNKITSVESSITSIEERIDTTILKDCLAEPIEYRPYVFVSDEALAACGIDESERDSSVSNEARNILKDNSEILNKLDFEVDYVINPKLSNHETEINGLKTRVSTLETNGGSGDSGDCLAKKITVAPYSQVSNEALAFNGQDESEKTKTTDMVVESVIKEGYENTMGCAAEIQFVVKPKIDSIETRVKALEDNGNPTDFGDCLAKKITVAPRSQITDEALTAMGFDASKKNETENIVAETAIKTAYECVSSCGAEVQFVVKPKIESVEERVKAIEDADFEGRLTGFEVLDIETKLPDHETRITALESGGSTHTDCLEKEIEYQPYKYYSVEAEAKYNEKNSTRLNRELTLKTFVGEGLSEAVSNVGAIKDEIDMVIEPRFEAIEYRVSTLESNAGSGDSGNCLVSNLTVKPLSQLSDEAFAEFKKQQPEAEKSAEASFEVRQVIKDGFEYALGVSGELQFVIKPAISNLKTKVGEFETLELGTLETGTDMYGNLVYTDPSISLYTNLAEAIQGVNANVSKNKSVIVHANNKAISLSSQMTTMNTRVDNISTKVDELLSDKNPTDDYHTYHKYHRLFTKTTDFPVVESAITFKYGNTVGVTKLKLNVYKDQVNTFQITNDMIPNHLKDASTLQCALILSLDYPGTFIRDGITISNETDVLFKLENVFIDVANNANSGAIIGDITLKNFTIYANDSVITVSMYNKPLTYTLIVEHDESLSGVTGIDLINIQHNINDETASRTIKFLDNSTEITPNVTKVVL